MFINAPKETIRTHTPSLDIGIVILIGPWYALKSGMLSEPEMMHCMMPASKFEHMMVLNVFCQKVSHSAVRRAQSLCIKAPTFASRGISTIIPFLLASAPI